MGPLFIYNWQIYINIKQKYMMKQTCNL